MNTSNKLKTLYQKYKIDIKDFKIVNSIKSGAFGSVYSVQNLKTNKKIAAKVLICHKNIPNYKLMVNREIFIMIKCEHPTIIKFLGYSLNDFNNENNATIFMELSTRGSLADLLLRVKNGLGDPEYDNTSRQKILVGIARGMMYLHQHQIIHRDLKPGNILLDDKLEPHITDFGLSKIYEIGKTIEQSQAYGTSVYMAPEVISGNQYSQKADVYSFGILMFEVVTDSIPYPDLEDNKITFFQFNEKVIYQNYRPVFEFPIKDPIRNLIERCWSKETKDRPTFEEIFNLLSSNKHDFIYDIYNEDSDEVNSDDYPYFLEDVDINDYQIYIEDIIMDKNSESNIMLDENINLKKQNSEMKVEITELERQVNLVLNKNEEVVTENINLKMQNTNIQNENLNIKEDNANLKKQNQILQSENETIKNEIARLKSQLVLIQNKNDNLNKKINLLSKNKINQKEEEILTKDDDLLNHQEKTENNIDHEEEKSVSSDELGHQEKTENSSDKKEDKSVTDDLLSHQEKAENISDKKEEKSATNDELNHQEKTENNIDQRIEIVPQNITIAAFNSLSMRQQQLAIKTISGKSFFSKIFLSSILSKLNNLINYLNQTIDIPENCIQIQYQISETKLEDMSNDSLIYILSNLTEALLHNKLFSNKQFMDLIKQFNNISFEIIYPSKLFLPMYNTLVKVKKYHIKHINITLFITGILETNEVIIEDKYINRVIFDSNVKSISKSTFYYWRSLTDVIFKEPSSLINIENSAFSLCYSLRRISIPSSVTSIKQYAFNGCVSLSKVSFGNPSSLSEIGKFAFNECSLLNQISIPSTIKSIEESTFKKCPFKKIIIPSSIISIGDGAFYLCSSLEQIIFEIHPSLNQIGKYAFYSCSSLKQIEIPSSVETIGDSAFYDCSSLKQVTIPSSIKTINISTFSGCSSLQQIEIPSSVETIGDSAFYGCSSLKQITFPSSVETIGNSAFYGCSSLKQITITSVKTIGDSAFYGCSSLKQITIPSSVIEIRNNAFAKCTSLKLLEIRSPNAKIGFSIIAECSSLQEIFLPISWKESYRGKFGQYYIIGKKINFYPNL